MLITKLKRCKCKIWLSVERQWNKHRKIFINYFLNLCLFILRKYRVLQEALTQNLLYQWRFQPWQIALGIKWAQEIDNKKRVDASKQAN